MLLMSRHQPLERVYFTAETTAMKRLLLAVGVASLTITLQAQSGPPASTKWESVAWGKLPAGFEWEAASQISTTPAGEIVVLRRANPFFVVLTPEGDVVRTWGENLFKVAHGLRIDRKGFLWVTDNAENFVQKYSPDGKLLLTIGKRGAAGGNDSKDAFDGPADVFVMPDGDILVADGYRNSRIVRFSGDGTFKSIIGGTKGAEPGQFNIPHAVVVDSRGRMIVADAENSRIQVFDQSGKFLEQWTDFPSKPRGSMFIMPDDTLYVSHVDSESISIVKNGKVIEQITGIGGRPHGVTMDAKGNLYVANPASRSVKKIIKK
jgi:DNA-binding beta-propeller fold protein YncE